MKWLACSVGENQLGRAEAGVVVLEWENSMPSSDRTSMMSWVSGAGRWPLGRNV